MTPYSLIAERLRAALSALVAWQDRVDARRHGKPCACRQAAGKPRCVQCRARGSLKRCRTAYGFSQPLRALVLFHERRLSGACRCGECLLCRARLELSEFDRARHGRTKVGNRVRYLGGLCKRGHLLEGRNAVPRTFPDGVETLECRTCQQAAGREYWRRRRPPKRIPGFCRYGVHEMTPENTCRLASGTKRCRACKRLGTARRRALRSLERAS